MTPDQDANQGQDSTSDGQEQQPLLCGTGRALKIEMLKARAEILDLRALELMHAYDILRDPANSPESRADAQRLVSIVSESLKDMGEKLARDWPEGS